jgi:zinc protease
MRNRTLPTSLLPLGLLLRFLSIFLLAAALPGPAAAQATRAGDLRYPPLPPFEIPRPERVVLDNGLVVMLLEDHELPLVDATALIRTGSRFDPASKVGLAELTGAVLRTGGTTRLSGDQLDDWLESKAAVVETEIGETSGRAYMSSLRQDFPAVLKVFAEVLRRPAFAEAKLQVAKNQARAEVARQNDSPLGIVFRELEEVVYGAASPYARTETYATLDTIQRRDLVQLHAAHFHPNHMVLGLVGDFDKAEALRLVREAFGDWPRGPEPPPVPAFDSRPPTPGVYYVEKNDVTQSSVALGSLGIVRNSPDHHAVEVMNHVLSGSFASRLFSKVRTQKALAYSVFGEVGSDWDHPGLLFAFLTTKTETTGAGIEALLEEVRNMTAQPPTPEEVERAKQAILNSFVFNADSRRKVLSQQLNFEYYGYPLDWFARYRQGIEAVTVEQVRAVAAKYLRPEQFAIVVVGPKEGTDKPLSTYGPVSTLDVTIPPPGR